MTEFDSQRGMKHAYLEERRIMAGVFGEPVL